MVFAALIKLYSEPQYLVTSTDTSDHAADTALTEVDFEEQTAGYQAAYSRLAASEMPEADPVGYVRDAQAYLGQELVRMSKEVRGLKAMLEVADPGGRFVVALAGAGYVL